MAACALSLPSETWAYAWAGGPVLPIGSLVRAARVRRRGTGTAGVRGRDTGRRLPFASAAAADVTGSWVTAAGAPQGISS
jgi:hypothetical protein